jgi:hypothetical protein
MKSSHIGFMGYIGFIRAIFSSDSLSVSFSASQASNNSCGAFQFASIDPEIQTKSEINASARAM